ncbi:MAG TPA: succinate dehydrogenase, cytochrome b556 subunit [Sphingomicrobium sp.]|jgi:succinate dehydrogenase / fumarate reductase cytochrome b subunit|nr:succinate dehydrogenase, cytochrome b556 subunit [Sphingomicrobium sp.]
MSRNPDRPLSPHLSIWRWGPGMLVSILHRITGSGLSVVGLAVLTWWLWALADGPDAYQDFAGHAQSWYGLVVLVGLTWAFWQHLLSGIRHLVMDIGAGFELRINKLFAVLTIAGGLFLTALTWFLIMGVNQ